MEKDREDCHAVEKLTFSFSDAQRRKMRLGSRLVISTNAIIERLTPFLVIKLATGVDVGHAKFV